MRRFPSSGRDQIRRIARAAVSKSYPIKECRHPPQRHSAMPRNLSVLGVVTRVIVTIESHDLEPRPGYGRYAARCVKRGGRRSECRIDYRCCLGCASFVVVMLSEMRRSCQGKAVGCGGDREPKTRSDIIFYPKDDQQISIGPRFSDLKDYNVVPQASLRTRDR